ncbi:MAG: NAD(P)/FAD-dependent oxidoreductase [Candidatus Thorarchaeota archaeon]|nr:NAD(P)/FAD-dependent oxidoreductase [Candidatus Thorarchaeota archaeon]
MTRDLIVVGGGPAGSACARTGAKAGLDVLVIEKQPHPRRKVCAGGFRSGLVDLLDFELSPAIERISCGAHLYAPSGTKVVCTKDMTTGYTAKRSVLDHFLLKKAEEAGAEVTSGVEVIDVTESSEAVTVHCSDGTSHAGKYVVGADGVNSRIARASGIKRQWRDDEIGLCIEAGVPMDQSEILRITHGPYDDDRVCIEIFFGGLQHGYGWCFPKKDEVSMGLGCLMPFAGGLKAAWARFIQKFEERNGVKLDLSTQSAMRVPLKGPIKNTITKRVMLVGDAGGFVSAATGEGIYYAIASGQMAAQTAADIIHGQASGTHEYQTRWKNTIGRQLDVSNFLAGLLFNSEKNMELVIQMAARDDVIRGHMTDLISGLRPYSELRNSIMKRVLAKHARTGISLLR